MAHFELSLSKRKILFWMVKERYNKSHNGYVYHQSATSVRPDKASRECSHHRYWPGCLELFQIFTLKLNLIESCYNALFLQPNLAQSGAFEFQPHGFHREEKKDASSQHPIWFQAELISHLIKCLDEFSTDVRSYAARLKILDSPSHRVFFKRTVTAGSFEMATSSCRLRQEQRNLIKRCILSKRPSPRLFFTRSYSACRENDMEIDFCFSLNPTY